MVHVWSEFAFSGTHGRVPAMVGILMAHVGREFAGSRAFLPHVYRRGVPGTLLPPVYETPANSASTCTDAHRQRTHEARVYGPLQTRGRSVPGAWCPPAAYSSSDQFSLNSRSSSWKMEMYFSRVLLMMESATESSYAWLIRLRDSSASSQPSSSLIIPAA